MPLPDKWRVECQCDTNTNNNAERNNLATLIKKEYGHFSNMDL
jgi:hypothetical protein